MATQIEDKMLKKSLELFGEFLVPEYCKKKVLKSEPTELGVLQGKDLKADYLFLLEDQTYAHFELQTTDKGDEDLTRFCLYDAVLFYRDERQITTYVIYTGNIKHSQSELYFGGGTYKVSPIYMAEEKAEDTLDDLYKRLEEKNGLTTKELTNLIKVPLMGGSMNQKEKIIEALKLSNQGEFDRKQDVQALLYALAVKLLKGRELEEARKWVNV